MATAPITPGSAPAPAPAASSPAPSAPVSTPVSTPAPAAPETSSQPQSIEDKLSSGWAAAKLAVPAEVAAPETPEPIVAEPADETKVEPEAEAAPAEEEFKLNLDDDGVAGDPKALADWLKEHPDASKALDDNPDLKGKVFSALRRDAENREIRQYIPDVETAKTVTKAAATFQQIDNRFLEAHKSPENAQEFLNHWVREAMFVGEDGKPVMEDGKYKLHPALPAIFNHITSNNLSVWQQEMDKTGKVPAQLAPVINGYIKNLETRAKATGDERLQAVVDVLREVNPPSSPASGEFPDELKPYAESIKQREDAVKAKEEQGTRQAQEQREADHVASIDRAETKAATSVRTQLQPLFAKSGLTKFETNAALREIGEAIDAKLEADGLYQSTYNSILLEPPSEAREKRLLRHMLTYTNEHIGGIASRVIREAKEGALNRQTDRQNTVADQTKTSKTDPSGTSIGASAPQAKTSNADIIADYKAAHNGEAPSIDQILAEAFKRTSGARKAG